MVHLDLAVDFAEEGVLALLADAVGQQFGLFVAQELAAEGYLLLGWRLQFQALQVDHDFLLQAE